MGRRALVVLLAAGALLAVAPAASACTRYASARGSDGASGTRTAPFRTVHRLLAAVPNRGVACLVAGGWFHERVAIRRPVTLTSVGGRATIAGGIVIGRYVPRVTVRNLSVRGTGGGPAAIVVHADRAHVIGNDVSGAGYRNRNTACILLDGTRAAIVDGNRVHNCTRATRRNLYAPGIFVASAYRARISNNVVYHTLGDGIALAPNAQHTQVWRNLVDGNVSGIYLGGNRRTASSHNTITRNIVSNSGRWNIHSAWSGVVGSDNKVYGNCLWHGFGGNTAGSGFAIGGNTVASPRYRNRPSDFTITGGPCAAMRPRIVAGRASVLPRFTVGYRLRALPQRVQVVGLTLRGLSSGASITVRCTARCGTSWNGRARGSTLALPVLRGAWLPRGAVVQVVARKSGWVGQLARIVVTGLPKGVLVEHGTA